MKLTPLCRRALIGLAIGAGVAIAQGPDGPRAKPMSFHNRLLLNRLAVGGYPTLEVMLALESPAQLERVSALIEHVGGRIRRTENSIGYLRAEVPIEHLIELTADPGVEAYQISSLSRASWYRDGPPEVNAEMFRSFEVAPIVRPGSATPPVELPLLSIDVAHESGYTADDDVGVGNWLATHPNFDGRGVTIAFLESAQAEFTHPTLRSARALDGGEIPKLAGILNTIDPEDPDDTRVDLSTEVRASSTWCRIGSRTYLLPRPGRYRFGVFTLPAGSNLSHQFGVIRDEATGEIRVDTDGDGDFREETPIVDVNTRLDVRTLKLSHPRQIGLAFVIGEGRAPNQIHVYTARSAHQAMTVSVAAGSRTGDSLAYGVASGARVLLVRNGGLDYRLHNLLEGYIEAMKRTDVDILCDSAGITMVPDTARDFAGLFLSRLVATYHKPIFHSAGNSLLFLNGVSSLGDVFSVGGSIGARTFAAVYGGRAIQEMMVHPLSASGPALDGAIKPDFLAPVHRVAAAAFANDNDVVLPQNAPARRLPRGYEISCCTSASSPYAAGVAALLLSAARKEGVPCSVETLGRALRVGARFLPGWAAHQQGNGLIDVNAAWRELQRSVEIPRIYMTAPNVHALTSYAADGGRGVGLFEREGWQPGSHARRIVQFRRESGTEDPLPYRVSWAGNDGTFNTAPFVILPLHRVVSLPVMISVSSPGVHSAILNLHDPVTNTIIFRSAATVAAADNFEEPNRTLHFSGSLPLMRTAAHYVSIPDGIAAAKIELEVLHGSMVAAVLPRHGLYREYYDHIQPQLGRTFGEGKYTLLLPRPAAGTWSINVGNIAAWRQGGGGDTSSGNAVYSISMRLLKAALEPRATDTRRLTIDLTNQAAELQEPVIETSTGTLRSERAEFLPTGLPNQFNIDVPASAATLALQLRSAAPDTNALELYLYDCTTGQCFSYDFTLPAATNHTLVVRRPKPGRWLAAVNPAPFPAKPGRFVLEEIITGNVQRHTATQPGARPPGARWTDTLEIPLGRSIGPGSARVLLCELIDVAAERDAAARPWENRTGLTNLADRPVAIGTAVVRLN